MKTIKKAQDGNKTKKNKKVPETPVLGDDLSISNAIRRLAKNPKDPENWVNQGLRLHPVIQVSRAVSEAITRGGAALGNKRFKKENARTDSIYNAQKKELKKDKNGGKVIKKAQKGANLQLKNISKERDSIERILPKVKKLSDKINKGKSKMPVGLDKKQTGGSIGSKVVKENPRQQKRLSRIKENNPERAERVEKRMVKRADRAMGARGAASRMKTGGKVAKKK
jgi:hypothetical protein